jgi:hypothetical protein
MASKSCGACTRKYEHSMLNAAGNCEECAIALTKGWKGRGYCRLCWSGVKMPPIVGQMGSDTMIRQYTCILRNSTIHCKHIRIYVVGTKKKKLQETMREL